MDNWFDDDVDYREISASPARPAVQVDDELFDFDATLRLDEVPGADEPLEPLPDGVEDLFNDRGVLVKRLVPTGAGTASSASRSTSPGSRASSSAGANLPSKANPFVEFHYSAFIADSDECFHSTLEYPTVVQLDFPPNPANQTNLVRGLDAALRHLSPGTKCEVSVSAAYAVPNMPNVPADTALRFQLEILDVRPTARRRVVQVDDTSSEMERLRVAREEREEMQARRKEREDLQSLKASEKPDRIAALREKLAKKQAMKGKGKSKKRKK